MRRILATVLAIPLVLPACAGQPPDALDADDVEDGFAVDDGKADNFYSLSAREFVVEGTARVVTDVDNASEAEVRKLVSLKHTAIAWFLNQYLVDKEEKDPNFKYGGFTAMVKAGSYADLSLQKINQRAWDFKFTQIIAGRTDLMRLLPVRSGRFDVVIGKPSNADMARLETNAEWYRDDPWEHWDPAKVTDAQKETLSLAIREEKKSSDAWWDYQRLFADGKLDIDVYFGWDYHSAYHLKHSRAFYAWLVARGFRSPVASFDAYGRASGPLTKVIDANGRPVTVEVRILYGKPGSDTDPDTDAGGKVLEDEMRRSVKARDVVVFSGHSGPFYGFALANWKKTDEGDFDDAEMLTAEMTSKYQIIVAEGCDTYMIGQAFLMNPAKMGKNVDVITTTSFSNADTPAAVELFLSRLIELDSQGRHRPRTLKTLLTQLDDAVGWGFHTEYGVHGVDDNPKVHPYAAADKVCKPCRANADCGGVGNSCIGIGNEGKRCAPACTDDSGCQAGFKCKKVASAAANAIYASMCVPATNVCPR